MVLPLFSWGPDPAISLPPLILYPGLDPAFPFPIPALDLPFLFCAFLHPGLSLTFHRSCTGPLCLGMALALPWSDLDPILATQYPGPLLALALFLLLPLLGSALLLTMP